MLNASNGQGKPIMSKDTRLEQWHHIVANKDLDALHDILADDIEFHSPFLWKPKPGRPAAYFILSNVIDIFEDFTYHRQWVEGDDIALEFSAQVDGKSLKGIDLICWPVGGKITDFEVLIRPANALMTLGGHMSARFEAAGIP